MKRKTEEQLKAEIKEKLEIAGIEQLLETHIAESSDEDHPQKEVLTEMLADLKHPPFYEIYQCFFEMGSDDALSDLKGGTRKEVIDDVSIALGYAIGLGKRYAAQVVERLDASHPSLREESIENLSTYWSMFFSILTEVNNRRLGSVSIVMDSLGDFSYSELYALYYNTIFYGRGSSRETELNLPALEEAVKLMSSKKGSKEAKERLKVQAQFEGELGRLAAEWHQTQPWILELDPKLKRIQGFYAGKRRKAGELHYVPQQMKEVFDFSSSPKLSSSEFEAYLSIAHALRDSLEWVELLGLLKETRNLAEDWRVHPSKSHLDDDHPEVLQELKLTLGEGLNLEIGRGEYLTSEDTESMDISRLSENTLFSFFNQLLKSEQEEQEEIANEYFIKFSLPVLYFLDRTQIMPFSTFRKMMKELEVGDELKKGAFYSRVVDLSYIFSFGEDVNKDIFERVCFSPRAELSQKLLVSLSSLRRHWKKKPLDEETKWRRNAYYSGILKYLGAASRTIGTKSHNVCSMEERSQQRDEEIASVFVSEFAQRVVESKPLETLLLREREGTAPVLSHLAELRAPAEEKIGAMKTFFSTAEEFYQQLCSSCTPETILFEYRAWLKEGTKAASFREWQEHFKMDSPYVRQVFLRYNAPASFEEQQEVVRMLAHMVSRRELPFGAINVPDLALEIPFGGGKTILLPKEINLYQSKRDNAQVYNLLTLLYAGMHAYGGFEVNAETLNKLGREKLEEKKPGRKSKLEKERRVSSVASLSDYFRLFPNYDLAESIFIAAEQMRLFSHLTRDFPGLEEEVTSYFEVRKSARERAKFAHLAHQQVFEAYLGAMLNDESNTSANEIQHLLGGVRNKPALMDSLSLVRPIYKCLEKFYRKSKNPIPKEEKTSLDSRVVEELMQELLKRGAQAVWDSMALKEHGYRYPEQLPGEVSVATVYEEIVPARKNDFLRRLLKNKEEQVAQLRQQLEQLVPEDPYLQRKRMQGTLDRRAFLRYRQDLAQGKVPDPRIYYKKIIEKRDVATVFALNLSRGVNQTLDGVPLRIVLQQMLGSFLEASAQLRDTIGIYGFSGSGRDNVVVYVFKDLEEPLSEEVYYRLGLVGGQNHNRNGAVYRHFTRKLESVKAERKLFVELCPNYAPLDLGYQGNAAVQDSALALNRMKMNGIEPLCICLSRDETSRQNLLKVYDDGHYLLTTPVAVFRELGSVYLQLTGK